MVARPNVVLILVDDMGFSDLGVTGSEIRTPHIDMLATQGALLTSMYNCARCCPTRASLLTGLYPHNAGVGHLGANLGSPAYQGFLRNDSATIAEVLRASGCRACMSGKWHVAGDFMAREVDSWRVGDIDHPTPRQRGFDRFYGIVDGVTNFFTPHFDPFPLRQWRLRRVYGRGRLGEVFRGQNTGWAQGHYGQHTGASTRGCINISKL